MGGATMLRMDDRMDSIEKRVGALETTVKTKLDIIENNTRELLGAFTFTKNTAGYITKYGPKVMTFGAGLMTAVGVGNPKLWQYISTFFT
jgi:hypothetical protein